MPREELLEFLRHLLDPAAFQKAEGMVKMMMDTSASDDLDGVGQPRPAAMDSRYRYALDSRDSFTKMRDLQAAQAETGITIAKDAEDCFRRALRATGYDTSGIHPSGLAAIYRARTAAATNPAGLDLAAIGRATAGRLNDPVTSRIRVL